MNILISGFKKFGDYKQNTSEIVVRRMKDEKIPGFQFYSTTFYATLSPTNLGETLLAFARNVIGAKAIISLGMASEKTGLCVEGVASNRIYHQKYVADRVQNTPVDANRKYGEKLDLDLVPWKIPTFQRQCALKDVPVMPEISEDAGGFCCNQLIYQVHVAQLAAKTQIPFIFIHVPCCEEAVADLPTFTRAGKITMTPKKIIQGLALLLENASL